MLHTHALSTSRVGSRFLVILAGWVDIFRCLKLYQRGDKISYFCDSTLPRNVHFWYNSLHTCILGSFGIAHKWNPTTLVPSCSVSVVAFFSRRLLRWSSWVLTRTRNIWSEFEQSVIHWTNTVVAGVVSTALSLLFEEHLVYCYRVTSIDDMITLRYKSRLRFESLKLVFRIFGKAKSASRCLHPSTMHICTKMHKYSLYVGLYLCYCLKQPIRKHCQTAQAILSRALQTSVCCGPWYVFAALCIRLIGLVFTRLLPIAIGMRLVYL